MRELSVNEVGFVSGGNGCSGSGSGGSGSSGSGGSGSGTTVTCSSLPNGGGQCTTRTGNTSVTTTFNSSGTATAVTTCTNSGGRGSVAGFFARVLGIEGSGESGSCQTYKLEIQVPRYG
jgi:hypothetical protein